MIIIIIKYYYNSLSNALKCTEHAASALYYKGVEIAPG